MHDGGQSTEFLLTEQEVRQVVRLLSDALAPDDGRPAKVARLMNGLGELSGADGWLWIRSRIDPHGAPAANLDYIAGGTFDDQSLAAFVDWSFEVDFEPPDFPEAKRLISLGKHWTRSRPGLVSDAIWRTDRRVAAYVERMRLDEYLYSLVPLGLQDDGGIIISGVVLFRKPGRPAFDERACRIAHLIVSECQPLHHDGLNLSNVDPVVALTPRQRTVLSLLIDGQSVKEVAEHLSLSPHTVNDHCKAIYRHFNVSSRAELLRRFMNGGNLA